MSQWCQSLQSQLTVGPVLANMKGKAADSPMKPIRPLATRRLLLDDRRCLLMLHMQCCTQVNLSKDRRSNCGATGRECSPTKYSVCLQRPSQHGHVELVDIYRGLGDAVATYCRLQQCNIDSILYCSGRPDKPETVFTMVLSHVLSRMSKACSHIESNPRTD